MKKFTILFVVILCVLLAYATISRWRPFEPRYPPLAASTDRALQTALEKALRSDMGRDFWEAVEKREASVVVVDITDPRRPRMAEINGKEMMYAASLPKLAVLLGAFVLIENGKMTLDESTRTALTRMIRYSSNADATSILRQVGIERLAAILQSDRFRLYDPAANGGLWVGRDYAGGPLWKGDPLHGISHGANAFQVARFYYLLITDRLVGRELGEEMMHILSQPGIPHKFVKGLQGRPGVDIFRKSGTWRQYHADSGIVVHGDYSYIAVALANSPTGDGWLTRMIGCIDSAVASNRNPPA